MVLGRLQTNCYIIGDTKTKEAVIIDPGYPGSKLLAIIENKEWDIKGIWLTHGHFDHIGAIPFLKESLGVDVWIYTLENEYLKNPEMNLSSGFLSHPFSFEADHLIEEGDTLQIGSFSFQVIHVPGHTIGSVCYYEPKEKILFSGDALFQGAIGRTDLPKGNLSDLMFHIKNKVLTLPDEIIVYPGHGPKTTIGAEKRNNPYVSDPWYENNF